MTVSHAAEERVLGGERQTGGLWVHNGKLVVKGGPVELPPASIGASELAVGAAQALVGSYAQLVGWTLPVTNVWTETPIQVTADFSGGGVLVRVEFNVFLGCPTKGQRVIWGIMVNGAVPDHALGALDAPENNYGMMASGAYYVTDANAGSGRMSFGLYGPTGTQIYAALPSTLFVTEQRR